MMMYFLPASTLYSNVETNNFSRWVEQVDVENFWIFLLIAFPFLYIAASRYLFNKARASKRPLN